MKWFVMLMSLCVVVMMPCLAQADETPPKGTGYLIAGGAVTGIGLVNLGTGSILAGDKRVDVSNMGTAIAVVGGIQTFTGLILLCVGGVQYGNYREWQKEHKVVSGLGVVPSSNGGVVGWRSEF